MKSDDSKKSPILEIKGLSKAVRPDFYKKKLQLINNINASFKEGLCTAIMGHNGAGKTTTIRSIFGLVKPDSGTVLYRNRPITRSDYRYIGYMPETNKLPMALTPLELLSYQLKIYRPQILQTMSAKELIEKTLNECELWEHRNKKARNMSKGMGRKLAWAAATIHQPELLILDEPFSGLDPVGRFRMGEWIREMRQRQISIIMCTHEFWSVRNICDEILIIRKGEVVFSTEQNVKLDMLNAAEKQQYHLEISGVTLDRVKQVGTDLNLPKWDEADVKGYVLQLSFSRYQDAARWVEKSLALGFIITKFHTTDVINEAALLQYF